MDEENRLPTALWVEAQLRRLDSRAVPYYVMQKGAYDRGTVLLKISGLDGFCRLLTQQRDLDGKLQWIDALNEEKPEESKADQYVRRTITRDPDVWVIEVEDRALANPFE
jgi:hypothetical protein